MALQIQHSRDDIRQLHALFEIDNLRTKFPEFRSESSAKPISVETLYSRAKLLVVVVAVAAVCNQN